MKIVIISLDMLVALPVLSVAMLFLFSSIKGSQNYLLELGGLQSARLNALVTSQQVSSSIDSSLYNYSAASQAASSISEKYGLTARLFGLEGIQQCGSHDDVCRLVTVSGNAYVLVVYYENAS